MAPLVAFLVPWLLKEVATKAFNSPDDTVPLEFEKGRKYEMNPVAAGLIRHGLTLVGGIVIAKGYADEAAVTAIIGGLTTIIATVWSVWEKRK